MDPGREELPERPLRRICVEPIVTFEVDDKGEDKSRGKFISMVAAKRKGGLSLGDKPLPEIHLRRGKLRKVPIGKGEAPVGMAQADDINTAPLNVSMAPHGKEKYVVRFEERQAGRPAFNRQAPGVPLGITQGIAINIRITHLHGHPGRRVAADSCQTRSVKHNKTILIRSQQSLEFAFFAPA